MHLRDLEDRAPVLSTSQLLKDRAETTSSSFEQEEKIRVVWSTWDHLCVCLATPKGAGAVVAGAAGMDYSMHQHQARQADLP